MAPTNPFPFRGLNDEEVRRSGRKHGLNSVKSNYGSNTWKVLKGIIFEPMFVLLLISAGIYHLLGEVTEALYMLGAIIMVSTISFYQEARSRRALLALEAITAPKIKVIRNNMPVEIPGTEVVVGDFVISEEGGLIPADGVIAQANDFSVNESTLTGESLPVFKNIQEGENEVFQGTLVASGQAIFKVTRVGSSTMLAKIQQRLSSIKEEETPLQKQIGAFVKQMVIIGGFAFFLIWIIAYFKFNDFFQSLLKALTLAMSILPEEIPVAFTTFMALGAWRMMKKRIIVKEIKTVEALGAATVICVDKTGTITENRMELAEVYVRNRGLITLREKASLPSEMTSLITYSMWASEPVPFDLMEQAIHRAYERISDKDQRPSFSMIKEYPLSGVPPIMTHVFANAAGERIIAAKGAPEGILNLSDLSASERADAERAVQDLATKGYRVLGVACSDFSSDDFPEDQHALPFKFIGLIAFYDPPKANIKQVFDSFYRAGIDVKIITGDNRITATSISRQAGLQNCDRSLDGEDLSKMTDEQLDEQVGQINLFTRMYPEAKFRIIEALKRKNNIVAMTGDGVNDGPALKAAHIGIAMGKRGSELARQASTLILPDDDLAKMVDAVATGRRIYSNLKKGIRYIISIHTPIILTVTLPLVFGWAYPIIFTPIHIIFFELIMGPTCSIMYENEPIEPGAMERSPRGMSKVLFTKQEVSVSVIQGLAIAVGSLFIYRWSAIQSNDGQVVCAMVFTTLCAANIGLTLVNRSFEQSVFKTLADKNNLLVFILIVSTVLTVFLLTNPAMRSVFGFAPLSINQILLAAGVGLVSVFWFEIYKYFVRTDNKKLRSATAA